ncbi:MAG: SurA N-terminal domain-containing protein [Deltaproteobacteria bacterium]|nr:SurA N-terminal domain-containing protein [Deltaproteobacteria bacterium]
MLHIMRKRAGSWVIKGVLLLIVLSFALFFGYTQFDEGGLGREEAIVRVGKEVISRQKLEMLFEESVSRMKESFKEGMPKETEQFYRQNLTEQLISQELAFLYARRLGLDTSDKALAREIQGNPNFLKNGLFDLQTYHDRWLPYYRRTYGEEFEEALRRDLTRQKLLQVGDLLYEPWKKVLENSRKEGDPVISSGTLLSYWIGDFREQTDIELY